MNTFAIGVATALTLATVGMSTAAPVPSAPATTCQQQLNDLGQTWSDVLPFSPAKPAQARVLGRQGHAHGGMEYNYMVSQFRQAAAACAAGEEHTAMLRLDTVRAIMKLPAVAHPEAHHYLAAAR